MMEHRRITVILFALGLIGSMAAVAQARTPAENQSAASSPKSEEKAPSDVRDPLPDGAIARLGTIRQRMPAAHLAFRPDGRTFITVVAGRVIGEWDAASGTLHRQRRLPGAPTSNCWLAPDGKLLAVIEKDKLVLWDVASGERRRTLPVSPMKVAFSADGKILATAEYNKPPCRVRIWDLADGKDCLLAELPSYVIAFAFSPEGKHLFAAVDNHSLRCWDVAAARQLWWNDHWASDLVVSPDGRTICTVVYLGRGTMRTWEASTGRPVDQIVLKKKTLAWAFPLAFMPDGRTVLLNSREGLLFWDVASREARRRIRGADHPVDGFALAPDGKTAITLTGSLVQRWNLESGRALYPDTHQFGHTSAVLAIAFASDGRTIATTDANETIRLWDRATRRPRLFAADGAGKGPGRLMAFGPNNAYGFSAPPLLAFTPDGQRLLTESEWGQLSLRRVDTGEESLRLDVRAGPNVGLGTARLSADGRTVWTLSHHQPELTSTIQFEWKESLCAWDAASGRQLSSHTITCNCLEDNLISPDGRCVALAMGSVVDVATGRPRLGKPSQPTWTHPFAFSADSRLLAAVEPGGADRWDKVGIYELLTGRMLVQVSAAVNWSSSLAFSPDGRLLIAAGADALHVWEVASGRRLLHLPAEGRLLYWMPPHFATCLAVAPDGRSVATGHDDGTVLLWDLAPAWQRVPVPQEALTPARLAACWADLRADEPRTAYVAMNRLTSDAARTIPFLGEHLRPVTVDPQTVERYLADLNSDDFATRERASRELKDLAETIEPRLRRALQQTDSPEARRRLREVLKAEAKMVLPADMVRQLRCVAALEQMATPEARRLLQTLSQGEAATRLTVAARDALRRLSPGK
jgi:WD40 repeat protein